ncbi:MAG: family 20 glycosylhydrolase [Bacteroidia bacterium]|nr:family 20 glycosylhydrolase [Bacteroidia bacterium]
MKIKYLLVNIILLISVSVFSEVGDTIALIPKPVKAEFYAGKETFHITPATVIVARSHSARSDAQIFNDYLLQYYGIRLKIKFFCFSGKNVIRLLHKHHTRHHESYIMNVSKSGIIIKGDKSGIFYGLQTLKQLLPVEKSAGLSVPACNITDYPRYSWRGMHLDVGRHFFPKEFIEKYIDYLAQYKMNTFHWHLTEDQGWRIEIKKYPKLTEIGAWRDSTLIGSYSSMPHKFDHQKYGGFYSQDDVREIVEYARKRHITIVPEIEMPGHSQAALASYPELSCTGEKLGVAPLWGVFDDVYCTKDQTIKFLEDVLTEVIQLFPGKYIHIGGDEVPKSRWTNCPQCQAVMKREKLKDENELQSYFIRRIEKFLNSKGKTLIGWDEILEGGLAPKAAVMSWRGTEGGIAAARQFHDVVMTPGSYCYFDHCQGNPRYEPLAFGGYTTVEKVYSYNPTPDELTPDQQKHILGAQGNVWTEYIDSPQKVEYMIFPRICALSEVDWTPLSEKNYDDFKGRLIRHFNLLDNYHINYSRALYEMKLIPMPSSGGQGVNCQILAASGTGSEGIVYTLDGSTPVDKSIKYTGPVEIKKSSTLKTAWFKGGKQKGYTIEQQFIINKATGKKITLANPPDDRYNTGGAFTLVDGIWGIIPWFGMEWLGFSGKDLDAVIDLGSEQSVSKITVDVLNAENSWIYLPASVEALISGDGINFTSIKKVSADEIKRLNRAVVMDIPPSKARYVKIVAKNLGKIPVGKPGEGNDAWLFVDEIAVE